MNQEILINNIDKIHTTEMGINRIKRNIGIDIDDVVLWCKKQIMESSNIVKIGKNWYVITDGFRITINSYSYTIITVHKLKSKE